MKRLFYLVLIITLPLIAFFEYQEYRRFHPPEDYQWELNPEIDKNYHDPEVLLRYYQYAEETGSYARWAWAEHKIDVRTPEDDDPETQEIVSRYQQYLAVLRHLEDRLVQSAEMKSRGLGNAQVQQIESPQADMTEAARSGYDDLSGLILAQRGDEGSLVQSLQQMLSVKGYSLRIDGIFDEETEGTIQKFQQDHNLDPTGQMNLHTLTLLKTQ